MQNTYDAQSKDFGSRGNCSTLLVVGTFSLFAGHFSPVADCSQNGIGHHVDYSVQRHIPTPFPT